MNWTDMHDVLLLGSQTANLPGKQMIPAAEVFPFDTLDINGEATINYDLSKFKANALPEYGSIADFGTLEHVGDPGKTANALRNVFAWTKTEGVMIHVNPAPEYDDPKGHEGVIRFTESFWAEYADLCKMDLAFIDTKLAYPEATSAPETRAVLIKKEGSTAPAKKDVVALINEFCVYV